MPVLLTYNDVKKQSQAVFGQFGESKWIPYATENAAMKRRDPEELRNVGLGKVAVLAAMGASLEAQIPVLKKYRDKFDLFTCDKGFAALMKHGIKPDYVMICDANIPYRWVKDYIHQSQDVKLIATCYANPEWTRSWAGPKYFYVNRDAIETERKFLPIMGPKTRVIPASSNVSNAMLVFLTGCDETNQVNWSGYDRFLLVGYDYSWSPNGNYYAWANPKPKRYYMHHHTLHGLGNDIVFTSENLLFSARWLYSYVTTFNLPVVNCGGKGLLEIPYRDSLESQLLKYHKSPVLRANVMLALDALRASRKNIQAAEAAFQASREALWH